MAHSVTGKLNKAAREHQGNGGGVTFFVDLGEKNYNFKAKQSEWTNYSAALFAKDTQVEYYRSALIEGAVIEVSGSGILIDMPTDPQYSPRLAIQDAKLGFTHSPSAPMPQGFVQNQGFAPQQPQQAPQQYQPQQPPQYAPQSAPAQNVAGQGFAPQPQGQPQQAPAFDDDIPF